MTQDNTLGAAWMREQAAVAIGKFLMTKTDTDVERVCDAEEAIRALPLPTDADLRAEAMKLPEVAALVEAISECQAALTDFSNMYPQMVKGFMVDAENSAKAALAPFTAAKETP